MKPVACLVKAINKRALLSSVAPIVAIDLVSRQYHQLHEACIGRQYMTGCNTQGFEGLRFLRLKMEDDSDEHLRLISSRFLAKQVRELLRNTPCLESLDLSISASKSILESDILGLTKPCTWSNLTDLQLSGLTTAECLTWLLKNHAPSLRHLRLTEVDLVPGTWEDIIELIRTDLSLDSFYFEDLWDTNVDEILDKPDKPYFFGGSDSSQPLHNQLADCIFMEVPYLVFTHDFDNNSLGLLSCPFD